MTGFNNAKGNMGFLKKQLLKNINAGEKAMGFEFEMTFEDAPNLSVLIRSTQMPAMGRADVEDFGPMGLGFTQAGAFENKGEVAATAVDTLSGDVLKYLYKAVKNKEYKKITIRPTAESLNGNSPTGTVCVLDHCKIRSDAIDYSTEDTAALVKPAMTITYNWYEYE